MQKTVFFYFAPKRWSGFFIPQKTDFFCANFLLFLAFCHKNAVNDYFDQPLACAAPKRWSKYTTHLCTEIVEMTLGCPKKGQIRIVSRLFFLRFLMCVQSFLSTILWNVTPLLGHFGGSAGFYFSLQSPPIPPLSFVVGSCTLFSVFMRVNACLPEGLQ